MNFDPHVDELFHEIYQLNQHLDHQSHQLKSIIRSAKHPNKSSKSKKARRYDRNKPLKRIPTKKHPLPAWNAGNGQRSRKLLGKAQRKAPLPRINPSYMRPTKSTSSISSLQLASQPSKPSKQSLVADYVRHQDTIQRMKAIISESEDEKHVLQEVHNLVNLALGKSQKLLETADSVLQVASASSPPPQYNQAVSRLLNDDSRQNIIILDRPQRRPIHIHKKTDIVYSSDYDAALSTLLAAADQIPDGPDPAVDDDLPALPTRLTPSSNSPPKKKLGSTSPSSRPFSPSNTISNAVKTLANRDIDSVLNELLGGPANAPVPSPSSRLLSLEHSNSDSLSANVQMLLQASTGETSSSPSNADAKSSDFELELIRVNSNADRQLITGRVQSMRARLDALLQGSEDDDPDNAGSTADSSQKRQVATSDGRLQQHADLIGKVVKTLLQKKENGGSKTRERRQTRRDQSGNIEAAPPKDDEESSSAASQQRIRPQPPQSGPPSQSSTLKSSRVRSSTRLSRLVSSLMSMPEVGEEEEREATTRAAPQGDRLRVRETEKSAASRVKVKGRMMQREEENEHKEKDMKF